MKMKIGLPTPRWRKAGGEEAARQGGNIHARNLLCEEACFRPSPLATWGIPSAPKVLFLSV